MSACKYGHDEGRLPNRTCRVCHRVFVRIASAKWEARNKERRAASQRLRRGLPAPTRPIPAACECCGKETKTFHMDHDHLTGKFRGWLCRPCNHGIGMLGDTLEAVQKAIRYLHG